MSIKRIQRGALQPRLREQPVELLRELAEWEAWVDEVAGEQWREHTLLHLAPERRR